MIPLILLPGWGFSLHAAYPIGNQPLSDEHAPYGWMHRPDILITAIAALATRSPRKQVDCLAFSLGARFLNHYWPQLAPYIRQYYLVGLATHFPTLASFRKRFNHKPLATLTQFYHHCFRSVSTVACPVAFPPETAYPDLDSALNWLEPYTAFEHLQTPAGHYHGRHDRIASPQTVPTLQTPLMWLETGHCPLFDPVFIAQMQAARLNAPV